MEEETKQLEQPKGKTPIESYNELREKCGKEIDAVLNKFGMKLDVYGDIKMPQIRVVGR